MLLILFTILSLNSVYQENYVMGTVDNKKSVMSSEQAPSIEGDQNLEVVSSIWSKISYYDGIS